MLPESSRAIARETRVIRDDTTERSRQVMHDMYDASKRGDMESFFALISPDIIVREPPFLPYGGKYIGIEAFQSMLAGLSDQFVFDSLTVDQIVADGDRVVTLLRLRTADGAGEVTLFEAARVCDGLVVELMIAIHDAGTVKLS